MYAIVLPDFVSYRMTGIGFMVKITIIYAGQ